MATDRATEKHQRLALALGLFFCAFVPLRVSIQSNFFPSTCLPLPFGFDSFRATAGNMRGKREDANAIFEATNYICIYNEIRVVHTSFVNLIIRCHCQLSIFACALATTMAVVRLMRILANKRRTIVDYSQRRPAVE